MKATRTVPVIIDGNNHNLVNPKTGGRAIFATELPDGLVTLKKCRELTDKVRAMGHEPKRFHFLLSIYEDWDDSKHDHDDNRPTCLLDSEAFYNVKPGELLIYKNGVPVYCNDNGIITRDSVAIMDCLNDY